MAFRYTGFADEADRTLAGQIAVVQECGWRSIELRSLDGKHVCDLSDSEWADAWQRLRDGGITIAGFGGQVANWARPITADFALDLAELRRVAPRMRAAGVKLLRIMSYPNAPAPDAWPVARWRAEAFRRLRELARIAEGEGVILAHENCSGYGGLGPDQTREMLAAVASPALKLIFDTGNNTTHDNDHEATWRFWEAVKDDVVHIHIKAYTRDAEGKLHTCFPDDDPVQARILTDLKRRGYCDWVSIEPHLAAAIHAGKHVTDADAARQLWLEYTRRLEALVARC